MNRVSYSVCLIALSLFLASCSSSVQTDLPAPERLESSATAPGSITVQVSGSADDAEQNNSTGSVALANSSLTLGVNSGIARTVGIRFRNVSIPKGATVTSAVLEFKASANLSGTTNFTIKGEAADNTVSYTTAKNGISSRTKTTASSRWQPGTWTSGKAYQSVELKAIVQQIISRSGWQSGSAMALQITGTGTRKVASFNSGTANSPKLIIN